MRLYAGIDLHSTNNYIGIIDEQDRRVYKKKLPNDLHRILFELAQFKEDLAGVVVESTFNWYWLVDGLQEKGYTVHLANPSAIKQYEGLKYVDDRWDSFWLAHLLRLNILPEGYIYPKEERPLRDLLRRRLLFVRQKASHNLSLQSMITRNVGYNLCSNEIKKMSTEEIESLFYHPHLQFAAGESLNAHSYLSQAIKRIEKEVLSQVTLRPEFESLVTIPGIGNILAMTIMLEVGDISRFPKVGNYSSYCRCVKSERLSNGKSKGKGNSKNGNKYLSWAYVEAAHFAKIHCAYSKSFYHRKKMKTNTFVATKALSNKLARASYYIMRDQVPYDPVKLFG